MAERVRVGDRLERAIESRADLEREIERGQTEQPQPRRLRRTLVWLGITAVSLYLVAPSLLETLGSWQDLDRLSPAWLLAMAALQAAALACLWALQRLALRARGWYAVITSQLAGNALSKVAPGGGAVGAALQYRMLVEAGLERGRTVAGLTAVNILVFAVVLGLPVLAIPAILRGAVDRSLVEATVVALVVFLVLFALGVLMLAFDGPLAWVGRTVQRLRNRLRRHAEPLRGLPTRLLRERDRVVGILGPRWKRALAATIGRWAFDYGSLLAALAALDVAPRPALVLLAFCAAQLLSQVPVTPGGVGFVEAGLAATLALAGVPPGKAVLATFAYRLFSYWLPLPLGLLGLGLHRRRFSRHHPPRVTTHHPSEPDPRFVSATGYEIRVKGRLSDTVTDAFEDFTASVKPAETVMRGNIRDQSELHGLLERIQSLGLELIEVRRLPEEPRE